jgi:hypothetical protein
VSDKLILGGFDAIFCVGIGEAAIDRLCGGVWKETDNLMPLLCGGQSSGGESVGLRSTKSN